MKVQDDIAKNHDRVISKMDVDHAFQEAYSKQPKKMSRLKAHVEDNGYSRNPCGGNMIMFHINFPPILLFCPLALVACSVGRGKWTKVGSLTIDSREVGMAVQELENPPWQSR